MAFDFLENPEEVYRLWKFGFWTMLGMVLSWFALCTILFNRLQTFYPSVHESIGKLKLFSFKTNTIRNNFKFLSFLFGFQWLALNDWKLRGLCGFMVVFSLLYCALFFTLLVSGFIYEID